jgi:hypothetical protein
VSVPRAYCGELVSGSSCCLIYLISNKPFAIIQKIDAKGAAAGMGNLFPPALKGVRTISEKLRTSILLHDYRKLTL